MKKITALALLALPYIAVAQQGKYIVNGQIGNFSAPAKVYLEHYDYAKSKMIIDSAVLQQGKFSFTGDVDQPAQAYVLFNQSGTGANKTRDYKSIYIEAGTINITGNDLIANAKVDGPKTNQENEAYNLALKPVNEAYAALEAKKSGATAEQKQSESFERENNIAEKAIEAKEAAVNKQFVEEHPDSYISMSALETYAYSADYNDIAPLFAKLSPAIQQTTDGKKFAERLPKLKAVALGAPAPEFTEADTSGKMVSLASFRGKYVLVDFWASWCGPCRQENPNVVKAYNRYKNQKFTILGVSLDRPGAKEKWLKAIHADHLNWNHVSDLQFWNSKVAGLYAVRAIPQNFLIDPSGKIVAKNLRGSDLEEKLAEIFGKI
jgi:peroxiredoxin